MARLANARVLVTGASGFIGSHLTRRLVAEGADVHALDPAVSAVYPTRLLDVRSDITLHEGNLIDRHAMDLLASRVKPAIVFHLAAYTHVAKSWERVDECVQANVQGTVNLLQALDGTGYERFVYTGTSEIYGGVDVPFKENASVHPISPYSVSKYAGELFCRIYREGLGWPIVFVRPFNAYGPAQSTDRIIPEIIVKALRKEELLLTTGRQTREFNFIDDLVDGFVLLGTVEGIEGELFNLGCGEETAIRDVVCKTLNLMGNPINPLFDRLPTRRNEIWRMYSDSSKARERLGWRPRHGLDEGLRKTIDWYVTELSGPDSPFGA
jgi:nucleoside-diphosphate-sugar epimerase